jgi:carbamoyl-phosphate synthase large subunit
MTADGRTDIRVLLTSCGGGVFPGMVECLRAEAAYRFFILGTDCRRDAVGQHFADAFATVPRGDDPGYAASVLALARASGIQVVVPLSDEEMLALSREQDVFAAAGIRVAASAAAAVKTASHKGEMLEFVREAGIETPAFARPRTMSDLDAALERFGYPAADVVIKPASGRGARGFWRLSERSDTRALLMNSRGLQTLPFKHFRALFGSAEPLPDLVAMQYLDGEDFNVDALCEKGRLLYCLPMERLIPEAGPVQMGRIVHDPVVDAMVARLVAAFGFSGNINVELAYERKSRGGRPLVYEINPRASGPIAATRPAGANLLLWGILQALGGEVPTGVHYRETTMTRCWREVYGTGSGGGG